MEAVLISIQADHNANIELGKKIGELRTRIPKCDLPIKFYTYESGKNGRHKVTNEWICRKIRKYPNPDNYPLSLTERCCVPFSHICDYTKDGEKLLHELVISDLVIYDDPRELSEFYVWKKCNSCRDTGYESTACCYDEDCRVPAVITRPPQSWMYVEVEG